MSTWHNSLSTSKPFRWTGLIKGCSLGIKFHVSRIDTRTVYPRVVEIVFASLNEEYLEVVIKIGQPAGIRKGAL